ncbi:low molecular weight protein arginine phosphatase [bacterium]|nr:low molecular weight protein arginine phosphatase [bacterium]
MAGFRILFVCTGNTCRSPLAEGIARREFEGLGPRMHVASAGTSAEDGACASSGSQEVAREHGLDLEAFVSRRLTAEHLAGADCVLVMEPAHRSGVLGISPQADTKTHLLGDLAGRSGREAAVPDPFGGPIESYRRTFEKIQTFIRDATPRLVELAARRAESGEGDA